MKVLTIGDDEKILEQVRLAFKVGLPEVKLASIHLGDGVQEIVEKERPDLVILDRGLPDIDIVVVLKQIQLFSKVPIIILTARRSGVDTIKGLELEADEYMVKPFGQMELLARVQSLIRRG